MHSRITFYVYAKIGQVIGGGGRPPLNQSLSPPHWTDGGVGRWPIPLPQIILYFFSVQSCDYVKAEWCYDHYTVLRQFKTNIQTTLNVVYIVTTTVQAIWGKPVDILSGGMARLTHLSLDLIVSETDNKDNDDVGGEVARNS